MSSLSIQHIIFVECFHPYIVLQVSIGISFYRRHENVTSFPLPSSILLSSSGTKSHLSSFTSKLNLSPRPSSPPGTSSPPNFQHVFCSFKICLFLMTLFNATLLNQPTQYILVFNILTDIILFFLVYLKFCSNRSGKLIHYIKHHNHFLKLSFDYFIPCNVSNITCCIDMVSFSDTSKAVIPVISDKSSSNNKNLDSFTKKYHECCTLFGLKQLIKCSTRVTNNSSSILDHVLHSFPDRFCKVRSCRRIRSSVNILHQKNCRN